jgi:transposase-like protein
LSPDLGADHRRDLLLDELFRQPADPPVRPDGPAGRILRDLWLGGTPLPRAAAAAGLTSKAAEETLRSLGLLPAESGRRPARDDRAQAAPARPTPKRPRRNWSAMRGDMIRLYGEGHTIRAIATKLGMHQREVWRQLAAAGVPRRARGLAGVVLSRPALERLYIREQLSIAEVARRFEVPKEAVIRNLRNHGLPRRHRSAPLDKDTLRRLYADERRGVRAVASRLGVSPDKVRAELGRYGLPIRPPGRPARPPS